MSSEAGRERCRAEASEYLRQRWRLRYAPTTLAHLASSGKGPVYSLRGRFVFYREDDLDVWAQSKIGKPKRKASEEGEARVA
jgi:hypothetical protein